MFADFSASTSASESAVASAGAVASDSAGAFPCAGPRPACLGASARLAPAWAQRARRRGVALVAALALGLQGWAWAQPAGFIALPSAPAGVGAAAGPGALPGLVGAGATAPAAPGLLRGGVAAPAGVGGQATPGRAGAAALPGGAALAAAAGAAETPATPARVGLEAAPGSEFQRFVAEATGVMLPRFGHNFFAPAATFAPLDQVPVPADYVLGPGDELVVRIWGGVDAELRTVIDRTGMIHVPHVGAVRMAGVRASEAETHLAQQVGRVLRNFELNVTLGQLRSIPVFVVGQAQRPGMFTVGSLSTLLNAVLASGGPSESGSMRRIELRRGQQVQTTLDLYQFLLRGDKSADVNLLPGDVIVFHPVGPQVALLGATDAAAVYELLPTGESLRQLLAYAGGLTPVSATHQVHVERLDRTRTRDPRQVQIVNMDEAGLRQPLRDGDIVTLFPVAPQFANAVTLRGNVAAPLRYPFTAGMRISDLIPDPAALLTPDYFRNLGRLVQFLGQSPANTLPTRNLLQEPNWEYAVVERINPADLSVQMLPFHLGRAVKQRDPQHNLVLQAGDVVTIFGRHELQAPQAARTRLVRVEGEVARPGIYQVQSGETLRELLLRAGGMTRQAYVFGTEFARESARVRQREAIADAARRLESQLGAQAAAQMANITSADAAQIMRQQQLQLEAARANLERLRNLQPNGRIALELDPAADGIEDLPDLPLEDGDSVRVPVRPGFVFAAGAVANTNALIWRSGRTVADYLRQAGLEEAADEGNIFVVRADGSVAHARAHARGWLARWSGNDLMNLELAPGDVIVVPEEIDRETSWAAFVRGLRDWTQILSQFGLAAVAIDTLRN